MVMRIAICDDEKSFLEDIIKHIDFFSKDNDIEMQKSVFTCGEELLAHKNKFDIAILDVEMNGIDGIKLKNHKGCDKKTVKKAWIEDIVVDSIRRLIMNDETIEYLTDQALETFNKESTVLPILQKQYAQTLTAINNLITAMEKGIITPTTKERMEELEAEKSEISIRIMKEEMSRPKLTREEILYWFYKFRKLNPKKLDHRRTLINNFVNSVFLFEDRMVITFNFKDGTETITFADLEKSALGSDLKVSGAPKKHFFGSAFFIDVCLTANDVASLMFCKHHIIAN